MKKKKGPNKNLEEEEEEGSDKNLWVRMTVTRLPEMQPAAL